MLYREFKIIVDWLKSIRNWRVNYLSSNKQSLKAFMTTLFHLSVIDPQNSSEQNMLTNVL